MFIDFRKIIVYSQSTINTLSSLTWGSTHLWCYNTPRVHNNFPRFHFYSWCHNAQLYAEIRKIFFLLKYYSCISSRKTKIKTKEITHVLKGPVIIQRFYGNPFASSTVVPTSMTNDEGSSRVVSSPLFSQYKFS